MSGLTYPAVRIVWRLCDPRGIGVDMISYFGKANLT